MMAKAPITQFHERREAFEAERELAKEDRHDSELRGDAQWSLAFKTPAAIYLVVGKRAVNARVSTVNR